MIFEIEDYQRRWSCGGGDYGGGTREGGGGGYGGYGGNGGGYGVGGGLTAVEVVDSMMVSGSREVNFCIFMQSVDLMIIFSMEAVSAICGFDDGVWF
ncbi:hypothetical protein L6452_14342 [Arctium lappa]|uniref:Uncharacterized protein n=1 Tax=Arctium lappa TaxID=4217 RepID=A0ACB9CL59_ARCLA|nr:hypothetical protein L6452_14342 [Arctium lappa]